MATRRAYTQKDDITMIQHAIHMIKKDPNVALKGNDAWEQYQQFGTAKRTPQNLCSHFRKVIQPNLHKFCIEFSWEDLRSVYSILALTPPNTVIVTLEDHYGITIKTNSDGTISGSSKTGSGHRRKAKLDIELSDDDEQDVSVPDTSRMSSTPINLNITEQVNFIKDTANARCKEIAPILITAPIATSTPVPKKFKAASPSVRLPPPRNDVDTFPDRQVENFDIADESPSPIHPIAGSTRMHEQVDNGPGGSSQPGTSSAPFPNAAVLQTKQALSSSHPRPVCSSNPVGAFSTTVMPLPSSIVPTDFRQSIFNDTWKMAQQWAVGSPDTCSLLLQMEREIAEKWTDKDDYCKSVKNLQEGMGAAAYIKLPTFDYNSLSKGGLRIELEENAKFSTEFRHRELNQIMGGLSKTLMITTKLFMNYLLIYEQSTVDLADSEDDYQSKLGQIAEDIKKSLKIPY